MVVESGATVKETQELARHSPSELTINVYTRTRTERLSEAVGRVGEVVLSTSKRVPSVYRLAVGAERESEVFPRALLRVRATSLRAVPFRATQYPKALMTRTILALHLLAVPPTAVRADRDPT